MTMALKIQKIGINSYLALMIYSSFRDMANFEPMLATLDNNKERLKIKSYGISDTTLEEVIYMK